MTPPPKAQTGRAALSSPRDVALADEGGQALTRGVRRDRRHRAVERRDLRKQRLAFALIGLSLLIIAGIIVAGYVITFVLPPRQVVVRVDDVEYTRADIVKLLRARQRGIEYLGDQLNAGTDIIRAVQLLVENEIIARSAPKFGISVSDKEVDAERRRLLALGTDQSSGQDSDQAQREFKERYKAYLTTIQMDDAAHRQLIENGLLREKLRQYLGESVPLVTEQVRLHRIVMSPEDKIEVMRAKFNEAVGDTTAPERLREA